MNEHLINQIIDYVKSSTPVDASRPITYPGERTLMTRIRNLRDGIPVDEGIWKEVLALP